MLCSVFKSVTEWCWESFFREFTCWLQTLQSRCRTEDFEQRPRGYSFEAAPVPPQVTISGVSGNIVQYNALNSPTSERTSRPWRSNSLTPPSCPNLSPSEWTPFQPPKGRSHSLTFERDLSSVDISPASSGCNLDTEKEIEDMIRSLPEGSGMKGKESSFYIL